MPLYEMSCIKCNEINEILIGLSELPKANKKGIIDLKKINLSCSNCKNTKFKKLISAHGKTATNWASWQTGLGTIPNKSTCKTKIGPPKKPKKKIV